MRDLNLQIVAEDTKIYTVRLTRHNLPVNISGWSLFFTVKKDFNDLDIDAVISKSVIFPNNTDSINGIGFLSLTSTDTTLAVGEYFYDFKLIDIDYRETFLRGKLIIIPTILQG